MYQEDLLQEVLYHQRLNLLRGVKKKKNKTKQNKKNKTKQNKTKKQNKNKTKQNKNKTKTKTKQKQNKTKQKQTKFSLLAFRKILFVWTMTSEILLRSSGLPSAVTLMAANAFGDEEATWSMHCLNISLFCSQLSSPS